MILKEYLKKSYDDIISKNSLNSIIDQTNTVKNKYPKMYSELNIESWENLLIEANEISIISLKKILNDEDYIETIISVGNRMSKYEMFDFPISVRDKNVSVNINIDRVKKYLKETEIENNRKLKRINNMKQFKAIKNITIDELERKYIQPKVYYDKDYSPSDSKLNEPIILLKWDVFNADLYRKAILIDGNNRLYYFMNENDSLKKIKVRFVSPKGIVLSNSMFTCFEEVVILLESLLTKYMADNNKNSKRVNEYLKLTKSRLTSSTKSDFFI